MLERAGGVYSKAKCARAETQLLEQWEAECDKPLLNHPIRRSCIQPKLETDHARPNAAVQNQVNLFTVDEIRVKHGAQILPDRGTTSHRV